MNYDFLLRAATLTLLPLVPAVLIFKLFPSSRVNGQGPLAGIQWKLGGAFAAYVLVVLLLLVAMKVTPDEQGSEVWTVEGRVELDGVEGISPNLLSVRTQPQKLSIAPDGSFVLEVVGQRAGSEVILPRLILDMTASCFVARTVALDGSPETFAIDRKPTSLDIKRLPGRRIKIGHSIRLERAKAGAFGPCPQ